MEKITIMIADDHKLIRDTWSFVLNGDERFQVIAECGDSEEAVEQAKALRPQIILMDINMTPFTGFEATEQIRKYAPGSALLVFLMHSQPAYVKMMLQLGARCFVS